VSRLGLLTQRARAGRLHFAGTGGAGAGAPSRLRGCDLSLLLEGARVPAPSAALELGCGARRGGSFLIFRQLCETTEECTFLLRPAQRYLCVGAPTAEEEELAHGVDAALQHERQFAATRRALASLGFTRAEQASIWQLLCAILSLGNVQFEARSEDARRGLAHGGSGGARVANPEALRQAAHFLELPYDDCARALLTRSIDTGGLGGAGARLVAQLDAPQAAAEAARLMRAIYALLVSWLFRRINERLHPTATAGGSGSASVT
jgi:myosin heavy subunit